MTDWADEKAAHLVTAVQVGDVAIVLDVVAQGLRNERAAETARCAAWARKFEVDWRAQGKTAAAAGAEIIAKKIESGAVVV